MDSHTVYSGTTGSGQKESETHGAAAPCGTGGHAAMNREATLKPAAAARRAAPWSEERAQTELVSVCMDATDERAKDIPAGPAYPVPPSDNDGGIRGPVTGIHQALAAVMRAITPIEKAQDNEGGGWRYRGIDDAYAAIHPLLKTHGIICTPDVLRIDQAVRTSQREKKMHTSLTMRYTFRAPDGSSVSCSAPGEAMDSGDKSTAKAMAIAHKYALFQTFCIPCVGMEDPDASLHRLTDHVEQGWRQPRGQSEERTPRQAPFDFDRASRELWAATTVDEAIAVRSRHNPAANAAGQFRAWEELVRQRIQDIKDAIEADKQLTE